MISITTPHPPFIIGASRKRAIMEYEPELYQNREGKFGPVPDIDVGATWSNRQVSLDILSGNALTTAVERDCREECARARMHTATTAGISGGKEGAYSIVMSGGYPDDVDKGDSMCVADLLFLTRLISLGHRTYTGAGGRGGDDDTGGSSGSWGGGTQTKDQSFDHKDNKALLVRICSLADGACLTVSQISCQRGRPVRVIRGSNLDSKYAPLNGYVVCNTVYNTVDSYFPDTAMTVFI